MVAGHVPAWRKLGLKLKYAKDISSPPKDIASHPASIEKKEQLIFKGNEQYQLNSRHGSNGPGNRDTSDIAIDTESGSKEESHQQMQDSTSTFENRKRKFVKFESDVKSRIHAQEPKALSNDVAGEPVSRSSSDRPKKLKKRFKHSQITEVPLDTAQGESIAATSDSPAYLSYLQQHHNSRPTWKFNKARQNQILKHAFSLTRIPAEYEGALYYYIMGLQGEHALNRLKAQSEEIIKSDEAELSKESQTEQVDVTSTKSDMSTPALPGQSGGSNRDNYKRTQYKEALARVKQQIRTAEVNREEHELIDDPHWRERFYRRKRAEILYWAAGQRRPESQRIYPRPGKIVYEVRNDRSNGDTARSSEKQLSSGVGEVQSKGRLVRNRKRKRRTGLPDDDTSSEESTISSEQSSSDEEFSAIETAIVKELGNGKVALPPVAKPKAKRRGKRKPNVTSIELSSSGDEESDTSSSTDSSGSSD